MVKKSFSSKLLFLVSLLFLISTLNLFSASKPRKKKSKKESNKTEIVEKQNDVESLSSASENIEIQKEEEEEVSFKVQPSNKNVFFYNISKDILDKVEKGSPQSIKEAMSEIRKSEVDYKNEEKILIYVATSIMEIVWPSVPVSWEVFEVDSENPYVGALYSVRQGVFDSSTGNKDFLSTILPALVMFIPNTNNEVLLKCEEIIKKALELNPESVLANYLMGTCYLKQGNSMAENYLKKAYEYSPETLETIISYADILSKNNKSDLADEIIKTVDVGVQNNLQVLKQNAYISFEKKDYAAAEEYVARVLQQTPNDLEFVLFRAKILIEKKDYIHAVTLLDMYERQDENNIDYLILRAKVQLDWSKNTSAAAETIEKAIRLYPDNLDALMLAAKISSIIDSPVAGKYADELSAIVLQKDPNNQDSLIYALDGLTKRALWQEAYEISSELIKNNPDNPEIINRHITVCIKNNKTKEAYQIASQAYLKMPQEESIIQSYVSATTKYSSVDDSMELINSMLLNVSPRMKSFLYYERSFLQRTSDSRLADLRASLIANPRNSDALFELYEFYYEKEDYRKAQYYLKQVVAINPNDSSFRKLNEALTQLIK